MRFVTSFVVILSFSCVWSQEAILRNDIEGPNPDGSYRWAIQTEGGIFHEERGSLGADDAIVVEGQYQYTAPDGQIIRVLYKADEGGFRAEGDHIPTPPPIPPLIQKALDYLATKPPSSNDYE